MDPPDTLAPHTFVLPEIKSDLGLVAAYSEKEASVERRIDDLEAVLHILDVQPWTAADLVVATEGANAGHSRLDRLWWELERHRLLGSQGYWRYGTGLADSPFWHCVQEAKGDVLWCLSIHQNRWYAPMTGQQIYPAAVVLANTVSMVTGVPHGKIVPGGDHQVFVAFSLATLLYATFDIPIPDRNATPRCPLWDALQVYELNRVGQSRPALQCLDLTSRINPAQSNDRHGLKPNLRADVFDITRFTNTSAEPTQYRWDVEPVMPWRDILRELAGYTKYAQAGLNPKPALDPLDEVRKQCSAAVEKLQTELNDGVDRRVELTVGLVKHATTPAQTAQRLRLLRLRMQALIKT
jgi:hypothetical protein